MGLVGVVINVVVVMADVVLVMAEVVVVGTTGFTHLSKTNSNVTKSYVCNPACQYPNISNVAKCIIGHLTDSNRHTAKQLWHVMDSRITRVVKRIIVTC